MIKKNIKYYCQFESPNLLLGSIDISDFHDSLWGNSGALDEEEYILWAPRACGMACLKMILNDLDKGVWPIVRLAKLCQKYGGYDLRTNLGLIYKPFSLFLKEEFNLEAEVVENFDIKRIKAEIEKGNYSIVSVHPNIRNRDNKEPNKKGGHLVLVVGFDDFKRELIIHNPAGIYNLSQENYHLSEEEFNKFFARRGIVVYKD